MLYKHIPVNFIETTLEKSGDTLNRDETVDDNYLISVQNAPIEIDNLGVTQQRQKLNKVSNLLYNGKNIVNKTHKSKKILI